MLYIFNNIRISSHLNQQLAMLSTVILTIVIGYKVFFYVQNFITSPQSPVGNLDSINPSTGSVLSFHSDAYASVSKLHLFGQEDNSRINSPATPTTTPEIPSILILQGILYTPNHVDALAIISEPKGKNFVAKKGDSIAQNISLVDILEDRIILSRYGEMETLRLKRNLAVIQLSHSDSPQSNKTVISSKVMRQITDALALYESDPDEFRKMVHIQKVSENDKVLGYRISYRDRRMMKILGMRPHDLIVKLNDIDVTGENATTKITHELKNKKEINLVVVRNSELRDIKIKIK